MKSKTYDEWKALSYYVRKGEKHTGRNLFDEPTFTEEQVEWVGSCDDLDDDFYMDHPGDPANYGHN